MDGYKIIDFKNIPIIADGTTETVPGVFNAVNTANKPMVIANLVIKNNSDIHLKPFFTNIVFGDAETGYSTVLATINANLILTIGTDDSVALVPVE